MTRRTAKMLGIAGVVLAFAAPALHAASTLVGSSADVVRADQAAVAAAAMMIAALALLAAFERRRRHDAELRDRIIGAPHFFFIAALWVLTAVASIVRLVDEGYAASLVQGAVVVQLVAAVGVIALSVVALRHDRAANRPR